MSKIFKTTPPGSAKMIFTPSRFKHSMKISAPVSFITSPPLPQLVLFLSAEGITRLPSQMKKTLLPPVFQKVLKNQGERSTIVTLAVAPVNTTCSFDQLSHSDGQPFHSKRTVYGCDEVE